jgi:chaperonin GroEL
MIHDEAARAALGRGVAQLARAVRGTLGPRGMNAIIDRPIGTPLVSRDGVSIAAQIELPDKFENMGAQILREVSMQTNEVAGDGSKAWREWRPGIIRSNWCMGWRLGLRR